MNKTTSIFYISLSSIPSRFEKLNIVIDSLINQTVKAKKIFINIPRYYDRFKTEYQLPDLSKYDNIYKFKTLII